MIIHSDWHIHSEYSFDASNPISTIAENAKAQGLRRIGITDHLNFNDEKFIGDIRRSAAAVTEAQKKYPFLVLGVELTPIERPEFEYIARHGVRDGYSPPIQSEPYGIELALSREELISLGIRYAVGAAHWRVDIPNGKQAEPDLDASIREWHRQQLYLASDPRVTILGHPWWNGRGLWYSDFSVIPHSMHEELAAALKENGKYAECNTAFFCLGKTDERFCHQYAEFLRFLFESGIPLTFGSDAHGNYLDHRPEVEKYLSAVGFCDGDFSDLPDSAFYF